MYLILIKSGESIYDKENKFTGWSDVELTEEGKSNCHQLGQTLKNTNIEFGIGFSSVQKNARESLDIIKSEIDKSLKAKESYKLNDKHYGALEGIKKETLIDSIGQEQVLLLENGFDIKAPELKIADSRFPGNNAKYSNILRFELPLSESLKDTYKRVIDYYEEEITTYLSIDENVLIVAHEGSLKALIKYLEGISNDGISNVEIPSNKAIIYELDDNLRIKAKKIIG